MGGTSANSKKVTNPAGAGSGISDRDSHDRVRDAGNVKGILIMTQQSRTGLVAVILFVIVIGCSNNPTHPESQGNTIYGSWKWKMSSGGFAGQTFTPESVHQEQKLVFGRDQRERRYIDGSLVYSYHFSLHKRASG